MNVIEVAGDLYLLLAVLGLALAVQYAGLPMLGQGAFVAVGGFGTFQLHDHGVPLGVAVLVSVLIATCAGYLLGLGVARLYGASLALATWALAWLVQAVLVAFPNVSGGEQGLTGESPARLVSPSLGLTMTLTPTVHLVVAAILCLGTLAALHRVGTSPAGYELAAIRENPALAASLGVRVGARRRQVLAITAALGALGGAGGAVLLASVAPADVSPLLSLELLVAVLLGGSLRPWGAVAGFAVIAALPHVSDAVASAADAPTEHVRGALTALLLVVALAARAPVGRLFGERVTSLLQRPPPIRRRVAALRPVTPPVLRAAGVRVSFGAVAALDSVDLELRGGVVHAVIGPNGSGKSTLLRVLSGAVRPDAGAVSKDAVTLHGGQAAYVRAGVVRTPQRTLLPAGLAPLDQIAVGAAVATRAPGATVRHVIATPSGRQVAGRLQGHAAVAAAAVGVPLDARDTAGLGTGTGRLLQIGRAVATGATVYLLDEPAAGMSTPERRHLAGVIRSLAGNGAAVCVVEHDMRFVAAVADVVTVLDAGRVVTTGSPPEVRADPVVRRIYLGEPAETA